MIEIPVGKNIDTTFDMARFRAMAEGADVLVMRKDRHGTDIPIMHFNKFGDMAEVLAPTLRPQFVDHISEKWVDAAAALNQRHTTQRSRRAGAYFNLGSLVEWAGQMLAAERKARKH